MSSCRSVVKLASFRSCSFFWVSAISLPQNHASRPEGSCEDDQDLHDEQANGHAISLVWAAADEPGEAYQDGEDAQGKRTEEDGADGAVGLDHLLRHAPGVRLV